ncbi:metal-dependent transcriptional regulator [Mesohalobacter halotolerans]|uniref:Transcriptional regulator MntR n=1 Tax=Mesohalobacter halotolerans TaxID=1883405 RepID=A0A4U5TSI0_9FLAO|nr:metal-dependent transcriptional regulator [Mesohalobacter halotolerans]MBS3738600.1 metal-dependent transcriptional regulator [Psychroflexus sp.]TKS57277.1 metal-dependent transcriptional regulator [Mesohalobacter halotolerans]
MLSLAEENYLKAIYHLHHENNKAVSTNDLSSLLDTKASSVTDMLKKLADKSLVVYKKYQGVKLSDRGENTALKVIRKHRLWEVFLVEKLNFNWDEVHDIAEQLEHIQSEKLTDELDRFLDYPKRDPHGDPIPNKDGQFEVANKTMLSELEIGESGICIGVKDSSSAFLNYLDKQAIALGKTLTVKEKESFDQSMLVAYDNKVLRLSEQATQNLYIKPNH